MNGSEGINPEGALELGDSIIVETEEGDELEFEVVGIVEDDDKNSFAICYCEKLDSSDESDEEVQPFIVTDLMGELVRDAGQAQGILDDFLTLAAQEENDGPSAN